MFFGNGVHSNSQGRIHQGVDQQAFILRHRGNRLLHLLLITDLCQTDNPHITAAKLGQGGTDNTFSCFTGRVGQHIDFFHGQAPCYNRLLLNG